MEIAGLPLHPLVVHGTVVLVPVSVAAAMVLALVPRWRWLMRWVTPALSLSAVAFAWLSTATGEELAETSTVAESLLERHEELGESLAWAMVAFLVVVLFAAWSLAGPTPLASGRGGHQGRVTALASVTPAVLVLASVGVLVLVVLVGDSGARAVWTG